MEPSVQIGEAARRLGLAPSAVRYYEQRGLVDPADQSDGRRRYTRHQLRQLTMVRIGRELGFSVSDVRRVIQTSDASWRAVVDEQVQLLHRRIADAERAIEMLGHLTACPEPNPMRDCATFRASLDDWLDGHRQLPGIEPEPLD